MDAVSALAFPRESPMTLPSESTNMESPTAKAASALLSFFFFLASNKLGLAIIQMKANSRSTIIDCFLIQK